MKVECSLTVLSTPDRLLYEKETSSITVQTRFNGGMINQTDLFFFFLSLLFLNALIDELLCVHFDQLSL